MVLGTGPSLSIGVDTKSTEIDDIRLMKQTALIVPARGHEPKIDPTCWLAPNASVIGEVSMGAQSTVWFQAVIRGDVASISIGKKVNIQDGAVIHGTYQQSETVLEDAVSIGHNAIVHGAHIKRGALIGMGAVVMDGAIVGEGAVVAAGAVVLAGTQIPSNTMWAGSPAREKGPVKPTLKEHLADTADRYVTYAEWFKV